MVAQALMTLAAIAVIGWVLWWATLASDPGEQSADRIVPTPAASGEATDGEAGAASESASSDQAQASADQAGSDDTVGGATSGGSDAASAATASPTAVPEPASFVDLIARPDLEGVVTSPLPECTLTAGGRVAGGIRIRCIEALAQAEVRPVAPGRIVHISRQSAVGVADPTIDYAATDLAADEAGASFVEGRWSWSDQPALGIHVVVDHGPFEGSRNTQTVYAGLSRVPDDLRLGQIVDPDAEIGSIGSIGGAATPATELSFSWWEQNQRQDGAVAVEVGPHADTQRAVAAALGPQLVSPTDPQCPLRLGGGQLPGAPRAYRNGTHQGIDFGCGTSDRFGHAIADGRVVYVVDDYVDPTVADREALLRNAGLAGFTPHWTLVMLYGNVVIIDHGELAGRGRGRVYTITAHLEAVDPGIRLGGDVRQGQVLGELGNRGTNASAEGLRGSQDPSLHLHWELFIENWYLGSGQPPAVVAELITTTLCGAADTPGCPG